MGIAPLIMYTGHQPIFRPSDKEALTPKENFMAEAGAKKTITNSPAKKGFYIVIPERKGAGPPKEGKHTEGLRSYHARKYMKTHSAWSDSKKGV